METVPRKVFVAANWKCNGDRVFTNKQSLYYTTLQYDKNTTEMAVCLPFIHLQAAKVFLTGRYHLVAQNVSQFPEGPYTGEISASQLKDIGVNWVLIGHSERRLLFSETEEIIKEKLLRCLEADIFVIFCFGENQEDRDAGRTNEVIDSQLETLFSVFNEKLDHVVLCYEPVWSFDGAKTVTPEQAQEVHGHVREFIKTKGGEPAAKGTRIIYES